jgi:hypothetical protein
VRSGEGRHQRGAAAHIERSSGLDVMWLRTVLLLKPSLCAMSSLSRPWAINSNNSRSRCVKSAKGAM